MQVSLKETNIDNNLDLKYKKHITPAERRSLWISRVVLWIMLFVVLFPIIAIVAASLSEGNSFTQTSIFPKSWTFENYRKVLQDTDFLIWVKNSMIMCLSVAFIQLALIIPAAFAFSKLKFAMRNKGLMALIILQMFPQVMALPAILNIAFKVQGMNNLFVLILIQCGGSAYNIWLMKGYMDSIPNDVIEAAYVDGASTVQVFTKIVLPLIRNMILVVFLFAFITAYSEVVFSSALLKNPEVQTVSTGMRSFIRDKFSANWTQYSAAAIMASVPVVALFLSLQKFIAKGLTAGSVKG